MAISARDLYFAVRVEDRATRPLRRIAADFRALGKEGHASVQRDLTNANQAQARAERARRNAAQSFLAARRAGELNIRNARRVEEASMNARRNAATEFMAARRALSLDIQKAKLRSQNALNAKREAKSRLDELRDKKNSLSQERRLADQELSRTRNQLKNLGLSAKAEKLTARELLNAAQLSQYSRGRGFPKGTTPEEAKMRVRAARATQRAIATERLALPLEGQLASQALTQQVRKVRELEAAEAALVKREGNLANAVRARAKAHKLAQAGITEAEVAGTSRIARTRAALRTAIAGNTAATARSAEVELLAQERIARTANTLRNASVAYRRAGEGVKEASNAVDRFPNEKLAGAGRLIGHIGRVLGIMGGVGVAAFGAMALASAKFETSVTLAATQSTQLNNNTVEQTVKNAKYIQSEIQKLMASGSVISGADEQSAAIYRIFSGVTIPGNQQTQLKTGIGLLKQFNDVTKANVGLVTLEESTRAGIILINRFGATLATMPAKLNIFQAAVRYGDLTMSEFLGVLGTVAPAAQGAGYGVTAMSAAVAFLSKQFSGSLRQGTTGYARLLEIFAREDVIQGLKDEGVAITQFRNGVQQLLPLNTIIGNIVDRFGKKVKDGGIFLQNFFKEMGNTQGTIQARRVLNTYVQHLEGAGRTFRDVAGDKDELDKSLKAAEQSSGVKWSEFVVQMKAFALEIGTGVIPAISSIVKAIRPVTHWFNQLSPSVKRTIGYFGLAISVGTLFFGVLLIMAGALVQTYAAVQLLGGTAGLVALVKNFRLAGAATAAAGEAQAAYGLSLGLAYAPLLAIIAAQFIFHDQTKGLVDTLGGMKTILAVYIGFLVLLKVKAFQTVFAMNAMTAATVANAEATTVAGAAAGRTAGKFALMASRIGIIGLAALAAYGPVKKFYEQALGANFAQPKEGAGYEDPATAFNRALVRAKKLARRGWTIAEITDALERQGKGGGRPMLSQTEIASVVSAISTTGEDVRARGVARTAKATTATEAAQKLATTIPSWIKNIVDAKAAAEKSPSVANWTKYYKLQEQLSKKFKGAQLQAIQEMISAGEDALKNQKKFSDAQIVAEEKNVLKLQALAEKTNTFVAWKKYYAAVTKLSDDATDDQLSAVQKMFEGTSKTVEKLSDVYKDVFTSVRSQYDSFLSQNQSAFGTLFQGPYMQSAVTQNRLDWGQVLNAKDLIKDARSTLKRFRDWRKDIATAQKRGLPKTLIDEIMKLGPEQAGEQLAIINKMTPAQLKEYKRLWEAGQKDIHDATMRDLRRQVNEWRRHGRRIALAIAQGLRDENVALEAALKSMINKAFPGLAGGTGATPGSTPKPTMAPPSAKFTYHTPTTQEKKKADAENVAYHDHYHITTTGTKEDVKSQVRHAHFQVRNRWHHKD